jgi:hypothetical protein
MIIRIEATGPKGSGKSFAIDKLEALLVTEGFSIRKPGLDGHLLIATKVGCPVSINHHGKLTYERKK